MSVDLSDFQKRFLLGGVGQTLLTEKEFNAALGQAKAEIMAVAIETSRMAVMIERQECAQMVEDAGHKELAEQILNRIPSQRQ